MAWGTCSVEVNTEILAEILTNIYWKDSLRLEKASHQIGHIDQPDGRVEERDYYACTLASSQLPGGYNYQMVFCIRQDGIYKDYYFVKDQDT